MKELIEIGTIHPFCIKMTFSLFSSLSIIHLVIGDKIPCKSNIEIGLQFHVSYLEKQIVNQAKIAVATIPYSFVIGHAL